MASQYLIDALLIHRLPPGCYSAAEATRTLISPEADSALFHAVARRLNHFINEHATPDNARRDACGNAIERKRKKRNQSRYALLPGEVVARWDAATWKTALRGRSIEAPSLLARLFLCLQQRGEQIGSVSSQSVPHGQAVRPAPSSSGLVLLRAPARPISLPKPELESRSARTWGLRVLFATVACVVLVPLGSVLLSGSSPVTRPAAHKSAQLVLCLPQSSAPSWEEPQPQTLEIPSKNQPPLVFSLDIAPDIGE